MLKIIKEAGAVSESNGLQKKAAFVLNWRSQLALVAARGVAASIVALGSQARAVSPLQHAQTVKRWWHSSFEIEEPVASASSPWPSPVLQEDSPVIGE